LHLQDIIRGDVKFETSLLDDKVLFKSDGMPTYHLAIVDDHLMETSHVIRGEEWLPSMPLHVLLYRAFGWDAPEFASTINFKTSWKRYPNVTAIN
jgi:glutamyl-tRNA synthetase